MPIDYVYICVFVKDNRQITDGTYPYWRRVSAFFLWRYFIQYCVFLGSDENKTPRSIKEFNTSPAAPSRMFIFIFFSVQARRSASGEVDEAGREGQRLQRTGSGAHGKPGEETIP